MEYFLGIINPNIMPKGQEMNTETKIKLFKYFISSLKGGTRVKSRLEWLVQP